MFSEAKEKLEEAWLGLDKIYRSGMEEILQLPNMGIPKGRAKLKTYDVLCAGIVVADLFTTPVDRLPKSGELSAVEDIKLECGGCAVNVAVNLAKLGLRSALSGKVGRDYFGGAILQELRERGMDTEHIRFSDRLPTSKTVILIAKGEDRRYVHSVGANAEFKVEDIDQGLIAGSRVFYVGGLLAMRDLDCERLVPLFQYAQESGTMTVLDVVVPADSWVPLSDIAKLLPYTDVFLPNEDEAGIITGETDPLAQARILKGLGAQNVIVTRGGAGSIALSDTAAFAAEAYPVQVVDASGGGDAFTSGLIYGLLHKWPLEKNVAFASALGASACQSMGCTTGTFTLQQANAFLQNNPLPLKRLHL